jgi:hypothetical protein
VLVVGDEWPALEDGPGFRLDLDAAELGGQLTGIALRLVE